MTEIPRHQQATSPSPATSPPGRAALTARALITGAVIGALLTPCNVYSGLKIGWSFNMSIAGALLGFAFWRLASDIFGSRAWGLPENLVNQTTASSAASIVSGGLVAPIPALALLGGPVLAGWQLIVWVFAVSALGVAMAVLLHDRFIRRSRLPFPAGAAAAETLRSIHGDGRDAVSRLHWLSGAGALAAAVKLGTEITGSTLRIWLPGGLPLGGISGGVGFKQLGIALDGSLLMIGFGAIIGLRAGLSLLLGAVLAWLLLAPWLLDRGMVAPGAPDTVWFSPLVAWLIWPGVALMTSGAVTSLWLGMRTGGVTQRTPTRERWPVPVAGFVIAATAVIVLVVAAQYFLFAIPLATGMAAVALACGLALVAARVVGETGIPPIGALGKIAQLGIGGVAPGAATVNLMGANVTGGAAGQTADLLNDLKAGALLGAPVAPLILAQTLGVLTGAVVGSLSYMLLIPDPVGQLLGPEWPAPAVATWKAVAEVMAGGIAAMPPWSLLATAIGAIAGIALGLLESRLPAPLQRFCPSATAMGLAFVIPAWIAVSLCLGALLAAIAHHLRPAWSQKRVLAIAAGLVAGESLTGVGAAALRLLIVT